MTCRISTAAMFAALTLCAAVPLLPARPAVAVTAPEGTSVPAPELEKYLEGLKSFEAQFSQSLRDSNGRVREEASGRLYLEKPGRFRWEYSKPNEQVIVSDGKNLWLYDVDLEQVTVKALDASLASTPALLLAGQASLGESFEVRSTSTSEQMKWYELTPKRQDTDFTRMKLGFEGGELRAMQLEDKLQQRTSIEFSGVKRNARLQASLFAFTPPQGVDVIGTPRR